VVVLCNGRQQAVLSGKRGGLSGRFMQPKAEAVLSGKTHWAVSSRAVSSRAVSSRAVSSRAVSSRAVSSRAVQCDGQAETSQGFLVGAHPPSPGTAYPERHVAPGQGHAAQRRNPLAPSLVPFLYPPFSGESGALPWPQKGAAGHEAGGEKQGRSLALHPGPIRGKKREGATGGRRRSLPSRPGPEGAARKRGGGGGGEC